jgi:hypothetical protein
MTDDATVSRPVEGMVLRHKLKQVGPWVLNNEPLLTEAECGSPIESDFRSCEWCYDSATADMDDETDWLHLREWFVNTDGLSVCDQCLEAYDDEMS